MPKLSYYQKKDKPTPLNCMEIKYTKKFWKLSMPSRCIWHYPALQWELQKVFHFLLEKSVLIRTALSDDTFPRKDIGSHPYALFPKTFQEESEEHWDSLAS